MAPLPKASAEKARHRTYDADEHKLTLAQLKQKLQTDLDAAEPQKSWGLTSAEAKRRLERDGPNSMKPPKKPPEIIKFLREFTQPLIFLLILASALCWIAYGLDRTVPVNMYCGIALNVIVVLQCTASYFEERRSAGVIDSLKQMMPSQCNVIREGQLRRIPCRELVVGDVVQLTGGDRVPADVRIIQTRGLKVESSSLTGEPDAFEMKVSATHEEPLETKNLALNTSQCTEGSALAVVYRTGDRTLIGMVASLASDTGSHVSTLQAEIYRVVWFIVGIACGLAVTVLIVGGCSKLNWFIIVNLVITAFVANVPQGLPATVTSCLGISAKRMFDRNVLVKNLSIIETLGSASCIASDKTGTLTQNKMSVQNFWYNGSIEMLRGAVIIGATSTARADGGAAQPHDGSRGTALDALQERLELLQGFVRWHSNPLEPLLVIACVCNSAKFAAAGRTSSPSLARLLQRRRRRRRGQPRGLSRLWRGARRRLPRPRRSPEERPREVSFYIDPVPGGGEVSKDGAKTVSYVTHTKATAEIIGDASEAALLRYCESIYPAERVRRLYKQVYFQPFNSTVKYALCVVAPPGNVAPGKYMVFLKGAPEVVLERCSHWMCGGVAKPIDEAFWQQFQEAYERLANGGERVLGFARTVMDQVPRHTLVQGGVPQSDFVFMGLASLMDPPKMGVDQAVQECRAAGIRTLMVTGDHALTAEAIAHQVSIITKPTRVDLAHLRGVPVAEVDPRDPEIKAVVITGPELRKLGEDEWQWLLDHDELVFARTTPQQKLEIVERLQARGEIVAVTGDGVNDAPALKKGNIGVAMGSPNASDVAREAADIIILDDDFCSIVSAIREGRLLFDNLKKSIVYTITHLAPEIAPVFVNIILGFPLGLSSMLILTIDLGSELVPAISLAYEEPEDAIMHRPPRNIKKDRMVTVPLMMHAYAYAGLMETIVTQLAYFCVFWSYGIDVHDLLLPDVVYFLPGAPDLRSGGKTFCADEQLYILALANAAVYTNIIASQMFHVWFCRTRTTSVTQHALLSNCWTILGMPWELAFIVIFGFIPGLNGVFGSGRGLPVQFWLFSLGFLLWAAVHTETLKYWARRDVRTSKTTCLGSLQW